MQSDQKKPLSLSAKVVFGIEVCAFVLIVVVCILQSIGTLSENPLMFSFPLTVIGLCSAYLLWNEHRGFARFSLFGGIFLLIVSLIVLF